MSEPLVSISCITYNHEKYIADTIEGFLMQKTEFPFEILIHDDASTDRTAEIIRSYEKKYPDIIKPIYQTENQYSQGKRPGSFNRRRAKGKYIAFCEGDDYWTDPYKLQKQIDAMENNPECNMCFHPVSIMKETGIMKPKLNYKYPKKIRIFSTKEAILKGAGFFPTASMIFRNNIEYMIHRPEWTSSLKGGHTYNVVLGSLGGGALFIPDIMAVYRQNTESSFSKRLIDDKEFELEWANSMCYYYDKLNEMTTYTYNEEFERVKWRHCLSYLKSISRPYNYKKAFFEANKANMPFTIRLICRLLLYKAFAAFWLIIRSPLLLINRGRQHFISHAKHQ